MNGLMDFLQQTSRTAGQTATGLVDLATLALRPLGYSIPDEKVFGTTKWAEKKGLLAPESQTPAGLAGQTVGNLLFPLGAGKSTQIADGLLTAQANAAAPRVLRKESGMFIGPGAKTWDAQAAKKAQTMAAKGVDPKTIWNETGTFKGPDGMWRQEIDDSAAALRDYQFTPKEAFNNAMFNATVGDGNHTKALSMRSYADKTKAQLTDEFSRTGSEIFDAALSGNKEKAKQLAANRGGLDAMFEAMRDRRYGPASSWLKHGELGKAYPDVYGLHTRISKDDVGDAVAHYQRAQPGVGEQMVMGKKPLFTDDKSTMLHELQHAIQQREGFARGGSPAGLMEALRNDAVDMRRAARNLDSSAWRNDPLGPAELLKPGARKRSLEMERQAQKLEDWVGRIDEFGDGYAHKAYRNLAGEAEARATQARMNMNMAQRREVFPLDSYDVPIDQLIVRGGLLNVGR